MYPELITLTTDFGVTDLYVGVMKGVILGVNPRAQLIDITHAIPPQDVEAAAFLIASTYPYFPDGAIHVIVVDPGVGSERRAIACRTARATFVCPDNGVLSHVLQHDAPLHIVTIENPAYCLPTISNTFHGRDVFAPVAAHLSLGIPLEALGEPVTALVELPTCKPEVTAERIIGHVIWIDHFGNLITNISYEMLKQITSRADFSIEAGRVKLNRLCHSYAGTPLGEPLAIIGSFGNLEISINQRNAADVLGLKRGDRVKVIAKGSQ